MSEKFLDQSGLVVLRNWVRSQIQAAQLGGSGLSLDADLLWENASPTAAFTAQKIDLDLSAYNGAVIEYVPAPNTSAIRSGAIPVYCGDKLLFIDDKSGNYYGTRNVYVGPDVVRFWPGMQGTTENNLRAIPMAIYGVNSAVSPKTEAVSGRTYLVKRFDPENSLITGFRRSKEQNGNVPRFCGWHYSDAGTGYVLMTDTATNTFCTMASKEAIDLTNYSSLTVDIACLSWTGNYGNCVGLIPKATMDSLGNNFDATYVENGVEKNGTTYNAATQAGWFTRNVTIAGTANTYTRATKTWDLSSTTGEYHLAAMVTGAGYTATMCILEAYLT